MPMQSTAQRGFLHANKPDIAAKFEAETPKGKKLPMHKKKKAKKTKNPLTPEQLNVFKKMGVKPKA